GIPSNLTRPRVRCYRTYATGKSVKTGKLPRALRRQLGERLLDQFDPGPLRRGQLALTVEAAHDVERPGEARARLVAVERQPEQADHEIGLPQRVAWIGGGQRLADLQ